MQVLLRPGCLLVIQGEAYSKLLHSIDSQAVDVITARCGNLLAARVEVGDVIARSQQRISLVFVSKQDARHLYQ